MGSNAQVLLFKKNKEDEKFQQIVYVDYKLEQFIYLLDVMISVKYKVLTIKPICYVL